MFRKFIALLWVTIMVSATLVFAAPQTAQAAFSCAASGQLGRPDIVNRGPRENTIKGVNGQTYRIKPATTLYNVCPAKIYVHYGYDILIRCSNGTNSGILKRYRWHDFPTWCSGGPSYPGSDRIYLQEYKQ